MGAWRSSAPCGRWTPSSRRTLLPDVEIHAEKLLAEEHEGSVLNRPLVAELDEGAVRAAEIGEIHTSVALGDACMHARDVAVVGEIDVAAFASDRHRVAEEREGRAV